MSKSASKKCFPPIIFSSLIIIHASFDFHLVEMSLKVHTAEQTVPQCTYMIKKMKVYCGAIFKAPISLSRAFRVLETSLPCDMVRRMHGRVTAGSDGEREEAETEAKE